MRRWRLWLSVAFLTLHAEPVAIAQSATITVVNSASYGNFIAPESIATIFGSNLSFGTTTAVLDDDRQLPTILGQTRVEINGVAAGLYFVSPGQINLLVPTGLTTGTATVVVRSTATGATQNGTAQIQPAAPGIFASDGSGSGPGAILNAINFRPAPFLVLTDSGDSTVRTVLAVFGTGLRNAVMVSAFAQDPAGNRYPMVVQFAGPAPGFFGLDQVNVLLPPDIDGAGTAQLILAADGVSANIVTFQMDFIPAVLVRPASLTLTPSVVTAGDSTMLTVGLTGVARLNGYPVGLQTSNAAAPVVAQLSVPSGKASAQTTVTTAAVTSTTMATFAASGSGVTLTTTLEIDPPSAVQLAGVSVPPPSLSGGRDRTGTVTLTSNAPAGGVRVQLTSDIDKARVPAFVTVPFGQSSVDFTITTLPVTSLETVTITATLGRLSSTAVLSLLPPLQLVLDQSAVVGGNPVTGTVTLGDPAPVTGATVTLQSNDTAVLVAPQIIPAGQSSQTFTLTTSMVTAPRTVTITAIFGLSRQTALLTVNLVPPPTLLSLTITPDRVMRAMSTQGTVTLTSPAGAGGVRVALRSSSVLVASVTPNFVMIPQGQTSATFQIATGPSTGVVTLTATFGDVSQTAILTVQ
jgi:uncharacterized protein (TIGR03437 family)